jgi:hypothetical protein
MADPSMERGRPYALVTGASSRIGLEDFRRREQAADLPRVR